MSRSKVPPDSIFALTQQYTHPVVANTGECVLLSSCRISSGKSIKCVNQYHRADLFATRYCKNLGKNYLCKLHLPNFLQCPCVVGNILVCLLLFCLLLFRLLNIFTSICFYFQHCYEILIYQGFACLC